MQHKIITDFVKSAMPIDVWKIFCDQDEANTSSTAELRYHNPIPQFCLVEYCVPFCDQLIYRKFRNGNFQSRISRERAFFSHS